MPWCRRSTCRPPMPATRTIRRELKENYVRNGNPDPVAGRGGHRCAGERAGCAALCLRHGGDHHAARDGSAGCPCGGAGRDVLRHARLAEAAGGARAHQRSRCSIRVQHGALEARAAEGATDLVWIETPLNPDLGRDRHRGGGEGRACGRRHSRGRCHGHRRRDHAAADAGRGSSSFTPRPNISTAIPTCWRASW